jgi:3-hydroxyacyl-CoA dehydrogenase/enoyl-CoA hydratase/3-hydroxybutyryl-CoA epimerase/3-hydroxyacyl-CoA dehydrogenase/enoyl-CoA hydratase/3-hydroxybutyryl-CoA epimerase/enoyl-CoA isomerase
LPALVKRGRLGQKSGAGFFKYSGKSERGEPDPAFDEVLRPMLREKKSPNPDEIAHRLFMPMLLEATRVIAEGIVRDARDVDLGLIFGLGFPPFKGGLLFWADTLGAERIVRLLEPLAHLGPRMRPTPLLLEMVKTNRKFYAE